MTPQLENSLLIGAVLFVLGIIGFMTRRNLIVTLYNAVSSLTLRYADMLNLRQEAAIRWIETHERITNREYRELCADVTPETLRLDLRDMVEKGILLQVGSKRGTYYILKAVNPTPDARRR